MRHRASNRRDHAPAAAVDGLSRTSSTPSVSVPGRSVETAAPMARSLLLRSPEGASTVARMHADPVADDRYMSLKALAHYSGLSVRTLRDRLNDPTHPLPHYRPRGKVLVRRSEFDRWMTRYRVEGNVALEAIVRDVLGDAAA